LYNRYNPYVMPPITAIVFIMSRNWDQRDGGGNVKVGGGVSGPAVC